MNDLTKSYYEIASEEAAKLKNDAPSQGNIDPQSLQTLRYAQMLAEKNGLEPDSDEYWNFVLRRLTPSNALPQQQEREPAGIEGTKTGEKDPARNKQDREEDEEDDEEMMDEEQRIQSKMTRYK